MRNGIDIWADGNAGGVHRIRAEIAAQRQELEMNRIFGVALFTAVAAAPVALEAQTPRGTPGQEQAERRAASTPVTMFLQRQAELGLTTEQVARLQAIEQRVRAQNAPLYEQLRASDAWGPKAGEPRGRARTGERPSPSPEQREARRQQMREMTPEQREAMRQQMREMTPEQREARRQQMREMTPEQREARRQQMREMTPEQREARRAEMRQRRLAGERGPVARGQLQVPEELRPVFQQLRDNNRSALAEARAVLTAEQQTRLLDLAQQRHGGAGERRWQGRGMRGSR
jgi:hypothetical protein